MMISPITAVIKKELRQRRACLIWWGIGITLLLAFTILAYGSIKSQADELNKTFGDLSSNISGFVGTSDMFSPVGYLNSQLFFITLPILFIILSVTLSSSLVSKEERHGTLELLLARPIGRGQLLLAKALSGTLVVAILTALTTAVIITCSLAVNIGVSVGYLVLATFWMALFSGAFGAIAFMLYAASSLTARAAAAVAILLSLGSYIVASLSGMIHGLAWIAKLLPYHYYDPGSILTGHVSGGLAIYIAAMYAISLAVAFIGFRRRDIA